jgi:hypothetical protein
VTGHKTGTQDPFREGAIERLLKLYENTKFEIKEKMVLASVCLGKAMVLGGFFSPTSKDDEPPKQVVEGFLWYRKGFCLVRKVVKVVSRMFLSFMISIFW